jgi:hypothetical protein
MIRHAQITSEPPHASAEVEEDDDEDDGDA